MTPARHRHLRNLVCSVLDGMPPAPKPTVLYFVICQFKDGRASVERDVTHMTRDVTLAHIRSGDLIDIVTIIETEFTPTGLSSRDVTEDMLKAATPDASAPLSPSDRLADRFDHERKLRAEA